MSRIAFARRHQHESPIEGDTSVPTATPAVRQAYLLPRDAIDLHADDSRLLELADRLWHRAPGPAPRGAMRLDLRVEPGAADVDRAGLIESWTVEPDRVALRLADHLSVSAHVPTATIAGRVTGALLERDPGLVTRLLLEVPVAALLQRRGYAAVHAAAIGGRRGAVVLRGAPGSGKSTLAAAAHLAGMDVLGDESVLVARDDPNDLLAAVRDPTLEPGAVRMLGLRTGLSPATERTGPKQRLDLFRSGTAALRSRPRAATVILTSPTAGPAKLEPLGPDAFLSAFRAGGIREERWAPPAPNTETTWAKAGAYLLSGAADLRGAISLLAALAGGT